MSIVTSGAAHKLRFGHRGGADGARQLGGVVIETRVPGDQLVRFIFDYPVEFPQVDAVLQSPVLGPTNLTPVKFVVESAPRPTVVAAAGVSFRGRQRTLSAGGALGNGVLVAAQVEGAWATQATTPAIPSGGLVPKGRHIGIVAAWPRDPASGPAFTGVPNSGQVPVGQLLRVRWVGATAVAAGVLSSAPNGTLKTFTLAFAGQKLAPGSLVITATVGAAPMTIRDTGDGRLVGQQATTLVRADGEVDYVAGTATITFSTAPDNATNITGNYEHTTNYAPLDIDLQWDAEVQ